MKPINNTVDDLFQPKELAADEYLNKADGLIYCSKCHTPRQHRIELKERVFFPTVRCRCQQEEYDKHEAERKHQEFLMQVSRLRATDCRTNPCTITTLPMIKVTIRKYRKPMIMWRIGRK